MKPRTAEELARFFASDPNDDEAVAALARSISESAYAEHHIHLDKVRGHPAPDLIENENAFLYHARGRKT